jgi:hypothetical protein
MPCHFLPDRVVLVTHGLEKKKPKLDQEDIDRAQRIYDEDQEVSRKMEEMRNKKEKSNVQ